MTKYSRSRFSIFGWAAFGAAGLLALRMVYEQTVLTWREGPQMVGFALAHAHPELLIVGLLGNLCVLIWLILFLIRAVRRKLTHRPSFGRSGWVQFVLLVCVLGVQSVPYAAWESITLKLAGPGPTGPDQLVRAAGNGDRKTVQDLLLAGVPVDQPSRNGSTALEMACRANQAELARFLTSKGARLEKAQVCRTFPEFADMPQVPGDSVQVDGATSNRNREMKKH